jgi:thioester reductase-like protein
VNNEPINESGSSAKQYVLLTGATGLVGRYLMRDLFLRGCQLAVIVRPTKRMNVQQRIESILQGWENQLGRRLPRPIIFEGDVCKTDLGLGQEEILWIRNHCDRVIHSAAALQFNGAGIDEEPWRTNLGGTQNVLKLTRLAEISHIHYVSTAYVCGQRDSLVFEHELETGQVFRNDYERSKFECEKLVRAATHFATKTIYRPSVIVGDSQTGFTSTYHGLFLYLRLLATLVPQQPRNKDGVIETPIRLPINGDEPRNLVPVDWVTKVISNIFFDPAAHGRTFHLTPDKCTSAREVISYCYEYFNSYGVEFCGSGAVRRGENSFSERYFENVDIYADYETSDPGFDKSNVRRFARHLACPPIDKEMILRFMNFGETNAWGKKRERVPKVARWFDSQLANVAKSATKVFGKLNSNALGPLAKFGLDIRGPGGGQWQLTANQDGEFDVALGLPASCYPVLMMDDFQVNKLLASIPSNGSKTDLSWCPTTRWAAPIESVLIPARTP